MGVSRPLKTIQISNKLVDILNKEFYKTSGFRELAIQLNKEDTIVKRLLKIENNIYERVSLYNVKNKYT